MLYIMDGDRCCTRKIIFASNYFPQLQTIPFDLFYLFMLSTISKILFLSAAETVLVSYLFFLPPPQVNLFSLPQPGTGLAHICPSVCQVPSWVSRPLTILQRASCQLAPALNSTLLVAPSACCQNCPHQSGTLAPRTPVPIRLSSGTFYPSALVFYCSSFGGDLFCESFSLPSFCYYFTCVSLFISSSLHALFAFIQSHIVGVFMSNHIHLCWGYIRI